MLYELAIESGARVDFKSEVVSVDPHSPSVGLSSGEKIETDIVLGTDGGESLIRTLLAGEKDSYKAAPFSIYAWVFSLLTVYIDGKCLVQCTGRAYL